MMFNYNTAKEDILAFQAKADDLIQSICVLSESLSDSTIYNIPYRLKSCVSLIPSNFSSGVSEIRKANRIKSLLRVHIALVECRDYLNLIEDLNYSKTKDIIEKVDDVNNLLASNYFCCW
jgi:four helix bundle protein